MSVKGIQSIKRDLTDEINSIITRFHSTIFKILKICRKIEPNSIELAGLHTKVSLARDLDPLIIINRAKDKVWMHREYIINEDANYFLNNNYSEFIKDDENKSFMRDLIQLIKKKYVDLSDAERKLVWQLSKDMLKSVVEYKKATNDFA